MIQVKDRPELARDPNSGAVVMTDKDAYDEYMKTYHALTAHKKSELSLMEARFQTIETRQQNIEELLVQILSKLKS